MGTGALLLAAAVFGASTFPIYSVAAAHAHDFASQGERVELSAALMFYFAIGAIAAPYGAARLMDAFGPSAMFVMISAGHLALVVFGLLRMRVRPSPQARTRFTPAPRTSFLIGRLTGRFRSRD